MADFAKTVSPARIPNEQGPDLSVQASAAPASGVAAALKGVSFLMDAQRAQERFDAEHEIFEQEQAQVSDFNRGSRVATDIESRLAAVPKGQRRLLKAKLEREFLTGNPSPSAVEGFTSVLRGLGVKTEAELLQAEEIAEDKRMKVLANEGREFVGAVMAGMGSPEAIQLYDEFKEDGFTEDELMFMAEANRGAGAIATRQQQIINIESSKLSLEKSRRDATQEQLAASTNASINAEIIRITQQVHATDGVSFEALQNGSTSQKLQAAQTLKQGLLKARSDFQNVLVNLSPAQKASIDLSAIQEDFNSRIQDLVSLSDETKIMQYDTDQLRLIHNAYIRGWATQAIPAKGEEGRAVAEAQKITALSLMAGVPADRELASIAVKGGVLNNKPPIIQSTDDIVQVIQGQPTQAATKEKALKTAVNSAAPIEDKVPVTAAETVASADPRIDTHNPVVFSKTVALQEQISKDTGAFEEYKNQTRLLAEEWGMSYDEIIDKQYGNYIKFSVAPTIFKAVEDTRVPSEKMFFEATSTGIVPVMDFENVQATGTFGVTVEPQRFKQDMRKISQQLNSLAKTFAKMKGVSTNDAFKVFAEALNLNMGLNKPEENPDG